LLSEVNAPFRLRAEVCAAAYVGARLGGQRTGIAIIPCGADPSICSVEQERHRGYQWENTPAITEYARSLRQSYKCDCDGVSHLLAGNIVDPTLVMANGLRKAIEKTTGVAPNTCPWRSFYSEDMRQVLRAHRWFKEGQLESYLPNPPHWLIEALTVYNSAFESTRAAIFEAERKARESKPVSDD